MGSDFNIGMKGATRKTIDFERLLISYGYANVIKSETRLTSTSARLLDLFITNYDPTNVSSAVLSCCIGDHMPICMSVKAPESTKKMMKTCITLQSITENSLEAFQIEIRGTCWDKVFQENTAEKAYDSSLVPLWQYTGNTLSRKSEKSVQRFESLG